MKFKKTFTQQEVNDYNNVNGDTNRLHYDEEFCKGTRFGI